MLYLLLLYWNYTVCLSTCLYLLDTFPCFFVRFLQSPAISNFSHQFPVWTIHIGAPHRKALNREHGEMFYYWRQNIPEASFSWYIYGNDIRICGGRARLRGPGGSMKYKFVYLKYLNVVTVYIYIYDIPVVKVLDPVPRTFDPSFQIQGKERKFTPCLHYIYSIYIS